MVEHEQAETNAPSTYPSFPATVGRQQVIQAYLTKLQKERFVVIKGRPGIGKSQVLASLMALHQDKTIVWLDCSRVDKQLDDVL